MSGREARFLVSRPKKSLSFGIVVKRHSQLLARGNRKLLSRCLFPFQGQYARKRGRIGFETARFFVRRSCAFSIGAKRTTRRRTASLFSQGEEEAPENEAKAAQEERVSTVIRAKIVGKLARRSPLSSLPLLVIDISWIIEKKKKK